MNDEHYEEMLHRMKDTIFLLRRGVSKDKIKELLETHTEDIAKDFIQRGF